MTTLTTLGTTGAIFIGSNVDNLVLLTVLFSVRDSQPLSIARASLVSAMLALAGATFLGMGLAGLCSVSGTCVGILLILIGVTKLTGFDPFPTVGGVWLPILVGNIDNSLSYASLYVSASLPDMLFATLVILALTAIMIASAFSLSRAANVSRLKALNFAPLILVGIGIYKIVT